MDYKNDERYWNINLLNKWFAISSIIFLISIIWMFLDDNDDEFKVYQKEFRKVESQIAQSKLAEELNKVSSERDIYEDKYSNEKLRYNEQSNTLDSLDNDLVITNGLFYKANMDYLFYKAEVDAKKYLYETELIKSHKHDTDNNHTPYKFIHKYDYENSLPKLKELKLIKESFENDVNNIELNITDIHYELKATENELNTYLKHVNLLENKLVKLDREKMSIFNKLGDIIRDLPIIDFMDPYYKVNQVVVNDVKYDVNFASVPSVDRCTSCHLGIDNPDFKNTPQPFTTHPRLDLYITAASPHSIDQFGCTSCHAGRARGTTFISSSHTPGDLIQEDVWKEKYN